MLARFEGYFTVWSPVWDPVKLPTGLMKLINEEEINDIFISL